VKLYSESVTIYIRWWWW